MRSKYIPEEVRSTVMNVFRIGLNLVSEAEEDADQCADACDAWHWISSALLLSPS